MRTPAHLRHDAQHRCQARRVRHLDREGHPGGAAVGSFHRLRSARRSRSSSPWQTPRRCRAAGPAGRRFDHHIHRIDVGAVAARRPQATAITRSGLRAGHLRGSCCSRCGECATPLPRVTKPPIASGGAGRQQRARLVISESTPTTSTPPLGAGDVRRDLRSAIVSSAAGGGSAGRSRVSMLRSENSSLPTTSNSASALRKPSCAARSSSLMAVLPSRCSSFSTASRPRATVWLLRQRVEPGAHLGLGRAACQIAQLGIEPVERRPAFLGGGDLDRLAVLQRRVQRHHRAVDRAPRQRWPRSVCTA